MQGLKCESFNVGQVCDAHRCTTLTEPTCVCPPPRGAGNPLNPTCSRDRGVQLFLLKKTFPVDRLAHH